jgi:BON domain
MAYRDEEFRGNRGNEELGPVSDRQRYSQNPQGSFGSEGSPQENFNTRPGQQGYRQNVGGSQQGFGSYGQSGGYSEEGGYGRPNSRLSGGFEGMDRGSQGVGGNWQQSGGTRGYGSEFGRGAQDFGGGSGFGEMQRPLESTRGRFTGRGPKGYIRSDERIREDVSDRLEQHGEIDASEIEVQVANGEVTLEGTVEDRRTKRMAEDIIETCPGVKEVHNRIRVQGNGTEREKSSDRPTTSRSSMKS